MKTIIGKLKTKFEIKKVSERAIVQRFSIEVNNEIIYINAFNNYTLLDKFNSGDKIKVDYNEVEKELNGKKFMNNYLVSISPDFETESMKYKIDLQRQIQLNYRLDDYREEQRIQIYRAVESQWTNSGKKYSELKKITDYYLSKYNFENKNKWEKMNQRMIELILYSCLEVSQ